MKVCIVGASGKLGKYMIQHALERGFEVVGVCRPQSVRKLDVFRGRITLIPGATNDREVIKRAVEGCDGVGDLNDQVLAASLTRRVDFARFMVAALEDQSLVHQAPAISGRTQDPAPRTRDPFRDFAAPRSGPRGPRGARAAG